MHAAPLAAILLLAPALALSACAAAGRTDAPKQAASPKKLQFAILMYERGDAWHRTPRAERDILYRKYGLWARDLKERGILKEGNPVGRGGVLLSAINGRNPIAERIDVNAENLTGYFIIETDTVAEAEAIAASCPALLHGETVHLRPVGHLE